MKKPIFNNLVCLYYVSVGKKKKDITKETLKPITKANSKLDKELQELEVESTKGGGDLSQ
ncbi:MAG TPA: hypothetical protein VIP53_01355 [Nitrososphaera sp.]